MKLHCLVHHRAENEKRKVNETKLLRKKSPRHAQIAIAFVFAIIVALVAFLMVARSTPAQFKGLDLGKTPAPDFRLTDQNGQTVALSDLRGKIVVLTFVYTQCVDVCPVIAAKLSQVYDQVGDDVPQVVFVAVSVSPEDDTPESIRAFSQKFHMEGRWIYLNGSRAELQLVWQAYYLYIATPVPPNTQVGHQTRVVLIDRASRERVHFSQDFDPADLVHDLRLLIESDE